MISMFKVINGLVRVGISVLLTPTRLAHTRGHTRKVYKHHAVKAARVSFFIREWLLTGTHSRIASLMHLPSICSKKRLDEHWQDIHYKTPLNRDI